LHKNQNLEKSRILPGIYRPGGFLQAETITYAWRCLRRQKWPGLDNAEQHRKILPRMWCDMLVLLGIIVVADTIAVSALAILTIIGE